MPYPRELVLDKETEDKLRIHIEREIYNHYAERGKWVDNVLQWQKDYWAEPTTKRATFPFLGASTIIIPMTAISVEAIHARVMTTIFGSGQLVSATAKAAEWEEISRPVEAMMDHELLKEMKFKDKITPAILSIEKYGTGVGKIGYERIVRKAVRNIGDLEQEVPVVIRDGSVVDSLPTTGILMPFAADDPQSAPWVGEEHHDTPYMVRQHENSGLFKKGTMEGLEPWVIEHSGTTLSGQERKQEREQENREEMTPVWPKTLDWVEMWLGFDVDGDGQDEEIVVHFHRGASLFMSIRYNWYHDLHRPYRIGIYFPVEHRWTGLGIGKQNEQFQREITTQHRQRLDNAMLANVRMLKVSKLSGYGPGEPIFPGKMWFLDNMDHVDTLQLGEIYNSAFSNEQATQIYSQQRTGVNEITLGQSPAGTPGTATGDLARLQEGNKKFDYVFSNIKGFIDELIMDTAVNIQQFGPRELQYWETVEGGRLARMFFEMPPDLIRHGLLIELNVVGQQRNSIVDRQNWVQIATLLQQYYTGSIQLAQLLGDQELIQFIGKKGILAATEAMRQILESYDIRNIDRIVLTELLKNQQNGAQPNGGIQPSQTNLLPAGQPASVGPGDVGQTAGVDQFNTLIQSLGGLGQ